MQEAPAIQQQIMAITRTFWHKYVVTKTQPPEPEPVELDVSDELRDASILAVTDSSWHDVVERYRSAKGLAAEAKALLEHAESGLKDNMLAGSIDAIEGFGLRCYYRLGGAGGGAGFVLSSGAGVGCFRSFMSPPCLGGLDYGGRWPACQPTAGSIRQRGGRPFRGARSARRRRP